MKKAKRLIAVVMAALTLSLTLAGGALAEEESGSLPLSVQYGSVNIQVVPELGFTIVTTAVNKDLSPKDFYVVSEVVEVARIDPQQGVTQEFWHKIFDANNTLMATVVSTGNGVYTLTEPYQAEITGITASISGPMKD